MREGKCGVCGDPWGYEGAIRENEPPHGKYATGQIVKKYKVSIAIRGYYFIYL